jgi:hypothetical protein
MVYVNKVSPFTGGKVTLEMKKAVLTYRGVPVEIDRPYFRCVDTGREFSDATLDNIAMSRTQDALALKIMIGEVHESNLL